MKMMVGLAGLLDLLPAMVWTALPDGNANLINRKRPGFPGEPAPAGGR